MSNNSSTKGRSCTRCKLTKPLVDFYNKPGGSEGKSSFCRDCYKEYYMEDYYRNRAGRLKQDRERYRKNKSKRIKSIRAYNAKFPEKTKARDMLRNAVATNKIIKEPCEICKTSENVHGHHEDYSKPLEVIWLCYTHHAEVHRQYNKPEYITAFMEARLTK